MASQAVRVRLDADVWEPLQHSGETTYTDAIARVADEWKQQKVALRSLEQIDASPAVAIGILLQSHRLIERAQVVISPPGIAHSCDTFAPVAAQPEKESEMDAGFIDDSGEY